MLGCTFQIGLKIINGQTLWQIFDPAKGSIFNTYTFPKNALAGYSIRPFYHFFKV